jgi:hypothetical protein
MDVPTAKKTQADCFKKRKRNACRYLTSNEALAYVAHREQQVDHCALLVVLFQDIISLLPSPPAVPPSEGERAQTTPLDAHFRRYIALIAQKGIQLAMIAAASATTEAAQLDEAWALLNQASISLRR